jgi:hypothetical protein
MHQIKHMISRSRAVMEWRTDYVRQIAQTETWACNIVVYRNLQWHEIALLPSLCSAKLGNGPSLRGLCNVLVIH